jgi:hypothetical protein
MEALVELTWLRAPDLCGLEVTSYGQTANRRQPNMIGNHLLAIQQKKPLPAVAAR